MTWEFESSSVCQVTIAWVAPVELADTSEMVGAMVSGRVAKVEQAEVIEFPAESWDLVW